MYVIIFDKSGIMHLTTRQKHKHGTRVHYRRRSKDQDQDRSSYHSP